MEEPDRLPDEAEEDSLVEAPLDWVARGMSGAYRELEHPADLFLEITGRGVADLFENALYAFYSQVAVLEGVEARDVADLDIRAGSLDEALRAVLAEALYRFDAEGFVAVSARVAVHADREAAGADDCLAGGVRVTARLWGGRPPRQPGSLLTEVKAVTYHLLTVAETQDGDWRATVLFDV
jgi:SHS2 domain-containing protein